MNPLVSIIIPAFNSESYISEAVESCLAQDYEPLEIIVVDDGSSDETVNLVRRYSNVKLIEQIANKGACIARNSGLAIAEGEYIKFLDSDDLLVSDCIQKQVSASKVHKDKVIGIGYAEVFDETGPLKTNYTKYFDKQSFDLLELILSTIFISLPLYPRRALLEVNGFDERLRSRQEWNLHIRLKLAEYDFQFDGVYTFRQRFHDAPHRITNNRRAASLEYENLKNAIEPVMSTGDTETSAAVAYVVWSVGRWYAISESLDAKQYFSLARELSPREFEKYFDPKYRWLLRLLGPRYAEIASRMMNISYVRRKLGEVMSIKR